MDKFTNNGYLESNLLAIWNKRVRDQNKDMSVLICGSPGNGKSALSWLCSEWMSSNIEKINFDWNKVAFTHDQWIENEKDKLDKYSISWYDEGYNTFFRRNAMARANKDGIEHLNQYRFKHHTRFINFQDIKNIEPDLIYSNEVGVEILIRVVMQGWFWFYSQKTMQKINIKKGKGGEKIIKWPEPDFKASFPDPSKKWKSKWKKYEKLNEEKLREDEDDEDDEDTLSIKEMAKIVISKGTDPENSEYINTHNNRKFVDYDLIAVEFDIGTRRAKRVKKYSEKKLGL